MKTLLAIQYFDKEWPLVYQLAQTMCAFQPELSQNAGVLFSARFDSKIPDYAVKEVSRHFHVYTHISRRRAAGWPFGCNELWFDTMQWLYEMQVAGSFLDYDTVMCLEADDTPLWPDWVARLRATWAALPSPKVAMGHVVPDYTRHINGNAMFSLEKRFMSGIVRIGGCRPDIGWDCMMAPFFFRQGGYDTPAIRSWYAKKTITKEEIQRLKNDGCVLLHGVKDGSGLKWAKELAFDTKQKPA